MIKKLIQIVKVTEVCRSKFNKIEKNIDAKLEPVNKDMENLKTEVKTLRYL